MSGVVSNRKELEQAFLSRKTEPINYTNIIILQQHSIDRRLYKWKWEQIIYNLLLRPGEMACSTNVSIKF